MYYYFFFKNCYSSLRFSVLRNAATLGVGQASLQLPVPILELENPLATVN
jgi:hypothetical protein